MGKKIDAFVLSLLAAGGLYLYFYRAMENHAAAMALSGICFVLLSKLLKRGLGLLGRSRWMQRRKIRRLAGGTLMHLACSDADAARQQISVLLEKAYGCALSLEIIQLPPSASLSQQAVFELWRRHRGEEKLVICATCICDASCRALCAGLKEPRIAVLDGNALGQLIAEHPGGIFVPEKSVKRHALRLKQVLALLVNRRNAPRSLLFSGMLMLMYLLSAQMGYLIAGVLLLFTTLAALRREKRPAKLF